MDVKKHWLFTNIPKELNYEALTDQPLCRRCPKSKYGTDYDISKFIDFAFDNDSTLEPGQENDSFGNYPMHGLVDKLVIMLSPWIPFIYPRP